jgi:hypothetical protein
MAGQGKYKYFAFISYNSADLRWGKRLERKLAGYRMPATLCSERGWERKPINPIFFAPYDIQPGDLNEEIKERLRASKNLIVICSPHSAQSEWVGREINYFHELGRDEQIYFFIVEGTPHSNDAKTECFNPIVSELNIPEILGANIHERVYHLPYLNKERAYVQLISKLLNVEFDSIWQRHKRRLRQKWMMISALLLTLMAAFLFIIRSYQPIDVHVSLEESIQVDPELPALKDATVTLFYGNDSISKLIDSTQSVTFSGIPYNIAKQPQRIVIQCMNFMSLDTLLQLSPQITLPLKRDIQIYGNIETTVLLPNLSYAANKTFEIEGSFRATSDENGYIHIDIPLEKQRPYYTIHCIETNYSDTIWMPCKMPNYILLQEN